MRPNILSVVGMGAVAGLAVWLAFEHQKRVGLSREHETLERQWEEMAQLITSNEQLSSRLAQVQAPRPLTDEQSRELLRLRGQLGVLREQTKELETVREENRQAHAALESSLNRQRAVATADYWPQDSWAFKGYASADAALQSSLWAANNGNVKELLSGATGEMKKRMEADLQGKSEAEASVRAMDEVMNMKSIRVVNREAQGDDTMIITAEFEDGKDTESRTQKLLMKKVGDEWKISGPAQ